MVSGLNFSWFSNTLYFSTICFKIHGRIKDFRLERKKKNRQEMFLVSRFHAQIVFFLVVGGHMPQTAA
jgi:hypothetical protein